ncbi:MAG: hypothetical protein OXD50_09440 [Chloroflexi bacterium]|nr:hypothetical protein [Chloroflexota bacterium]
MSPLLLAPKLWLRAAMLAALGVLVLFLGIEFSSAQQTDYSDWELLICSHPGASVHPDGSLLDGDSSTGDSIYIHPTHGDYTESISTGGVWPNRGWGSYIYWSSLLVEHNDGTCSLRASFRIAKWGEAAQTARASYQPCPVEVPVLTDDPNHEDYSVGRTDSGTRIRSIRVWLNRDMVADELSIPCDAEDPSALLPGQDPPSDDASSDSGSGNSNVDDGGNSVSGEDANAAEPVNGGGQTPTVNNAPNPTRTNTNPTPTQTNNNQASTTTESNQAGSDISPNQSSVSNTSDEDGEDTGASTTGVSEETSGNDALEDDVSEDLLEDAGSSETAWVKPDERAESQEQTQIARPRAPRTGTGGAAAESSDREGAIALTAFVAAVAVIGIVSLTLYRRRGKPQSQ